jgi:hypothetical protein
MITQGLCANTGKTALVAGKVMPTTINLREGQRQISMAERTKEEIKNLSARFWLNVTPLGLAEKGSASSRCVKSTLRPFREGATRIRGRVRANFVV